TGSAPTTETPRPAPDDSAAHRETAEVPVRHHRATVSRGARRAHGGRPPDGSWPAPDQSTRAAPCQSKRCCASARDNDWPRQNGLLPASEPKSGETVLPPGVAI